MKKKVLFCIKKVKNDFLTNVFSPRPSDYPAVSPSLKVIHWIQAKSFSPNKKKGKKTYYFCILYFKQKQRKTHREGGEIYKSLLSSNRFWMLLSLIRYCAHRTTSKFKAAEVISISLRSELIQIETNRIRNNFKLSSPSQTFNPFSIGIQIEERGKYRANIFQRNNFFIANNVPKISC
jgi:hypothetical protein